MRSGPTICASAAAAQAESAPPETITTPSEVESTRPDASAASFSLSSAFPFVTN